MIGKTVSHYRIVGSLGSGGMGVVYSGEDVRLGRQVALKFVPEELAKDRQAIDRLNSEARTASGLSHPNICTIYDVGEYEGQPFIVMERLNGETLRERLEASPLKIKEVVELGIQVADALDAAHQRSIIHRDIKPANLFMMDRGHVKVLDFGLAKLVSRRTDAAITAGMTVDRTAEGVTLGTVSYMSPEQVTGDDLDGRSDLFSLGVVLYEAVTGHQPFTGKTSAVIFSAILTRAPVAPIAFNPEVPLRLQEVINNCLEKDRELRYQNAADLRADLKRVRRDMESGQSGVFRTTASVPIGHRDRPGSGGHDVTVAAPNPSPQTVAAPAPSAADARASKGFMLGIAAAVAATVVGGGIWIATRPKPAAQTASDSTASASSSRARLALATSSFESKDYRAALRYAEEALQFAPGDGDALRMQEAARTMLTRFDAAVAQAGERLNAGDLDGATRALNTARAIDPAASVLGDLSARIAASPRVPEKSPREAGVPARSDTRARPLEAAPQVRTAAPPVPQAPNAAAAARAPAARESVPPPPPVPAPPTTAAPPSSSARAPEPPPPASPPAAPRTEPTERADPSAAAPHATESDDAAIRRVIATYARAIETKDLALYQTAKPNLSSDERRRVEEGFRAVTSQRVAITVVSIEQRGQEATVPLRRRDTIQAGGRQQTSDILQTMTLTRSAAGWSIREIGR